MFSSGCFSTYLSYTGFPCLYHLPELAQVCEVSTKGCCCRDHSHPHPLGGRQGQGGDVPCIWKVWIYKDVRGLGCYFNKYCVAEPEPKVYL